MKSTREEEGTGESRSARKEEVNGGELGWWWWESNHRAAALSGKGEERSNSKRGRHCSISSPPFSFSSSFFPPLSNSHLMFRFSVFARAGCTEHK